MDLKHISDDELYSMVLEENDDAKNILFDRYHVYIKVLIKKYCKKAKFLGIDYVDLYCEGLLAFSDGLSSYSQNKNASFMTFIRLCVERRMLNLIKKASSKKNQMISNAYSLDYIYDDYELPLIELLGDERLDPLFKVSKEESYQILLKEIQNSLSNSEYEVFEYMCDDLSYQQIATKLNKTPKQIDNTIQRIKLKIKYILEIIE